MTQPLSPEALAYILRSVYDRAVIRELLALGGVCPECGGDGYVSCGAAGWATKPCPCCALGEDGEIGEG